MANYNCTIRTNYFKVKDADAFKKLINVTRSESGIQLLEKTDANGVTNYGFGCYSDISGVPVDENGDVVYVADDIYDYDADYDAFLAELQKCVADDDAILIYEAGHCNLREVTGRADIITATSIDYLNLTSAALTKAAGMLGNPNWTTVSEY